MNATKYYEIVKRHEGPPRLVDASDNEMSTVSLVDVKVRFGKLGPVVLQNVIICDIGFCFESLAGLLAWLSGRNDSCLTKETAKGSLWVPLAKEPGVGGLLLSQVHAGKKLLNPRQWKWIVLRTLEKARMV